MPILSGFVVLAALAKQVFLKHRIGTGFAFAEIQRSSFGSIRIWFVSKNHAVAPWLLKTKKFIGSKKKGTLQEQNIFR